MTRKLTRDEQRIRAELKQQVLARAETNQEALSYYDGSVRVHSLNIAVPPQLANIGVVCDWPSTVVDTHHERMNFLGWDDGDGYGMAEFNRTFAAADRIQESVQDSLIYGVGFLSVEQVPGTNQWALHSVSPLDGTLRWDPITGRASAALRIIRNAGLSADGWVYSREVIHFEGYSIVVQPGTHPNDAEVVYEYKTVPGMVPFFRIRNKLRSREWYGRSLITPSVKYYTQAAARTMLGMEINREFYTTPQRYAMGADMSDFTASDNPSHQEMVEAGWRVTMGRMLAIPRDEDGQVPSVGQFTAAPPTPYIEQLRAYSQLLASATGLPTAYLGFSTENPPSGDAIRAWLERLIRSIEGQQRLITGDLNQLGWTLLYLTGTARPVWAEFTKQVAPKWESPATQQLAAESDALVKLIGAGVLPATHPWVLDRLRIPLEDQRAMKAELAKQTADKRLNELGSKLGTVKSDDLAGLQE